MGLHTTMEHDVCERLYAQSPATTGLKCSVTATSQLEDTGERAHNGRPGGLHRFPKLKNQTE